MGDILRADATRLTLLADLWQQMGLLGAAEEPPVPRVRRQQGTV